MANIGKLRIVDLVGARRHEQAHALDMRVQTLPPYRPRPPPDAVPDVVHDLRSPLNTVLGIAEVLTEGSPSAQQRSQVEMIQRAGNRMLALVNELLEVPRAHAPAGQTS